MNKLVGGFFIGLCVFLCSPVLLSKTLTTIILLVCLGLLLFCFKTNDRSGWLSAVLLLACFCLGAIYQNIYSVWQLSYQGVYTQLQPELSNQVSDKRVLVEASVVTLPIHVKHLEESASRGQPDRILVEILKINHRSFPWYAPSQYATVYVYQDDSIASKNKFWDQGQKIRFESNIRPATKLANEFGFDEYRYNLLKQIKATFVTKQVSLVKDEKSVKITSLKQRQLTALHSKLFCKECHFDQPGVLFSLLTGDKSFLSSEQKNKLNTLV